MPASGTESRCCAVAVVVVAAAIAMLSLLYFLAIVTLGSRCQSTPLLRFTMHHNGRYSFVYTDTRVASLNIRWDKEEGVSGVT